MKEANLEFSNRADVIGAEDGYNQSWSAHSSYKVYFSKNEDWIETAHPDPNRAQKGHVILNNGETDVHFKRPDGLNELFFEPFLNRLSYSVGANVTPTFLVVHDNRFGVGSVSAGTSLSSRSYTDFLKWEGSSFLAEHFVFNVWFAHRDWAPDKYSNIAYKVDKNGTFSSACEIDRSHTLFKPDGKFGEDEIGELSRTFTLTTTDIFFGKEVFFRYPNRALEGVRKVEALKDSEIYREAMSVARLVTRILPSRRNYFRDLAMACSRVLIARKRRLREWIEELFILNPQFSSFPETAY